MASMTMLAAIRETLLDEMARDERGRAARRGRRDERRRVPRHRRRARALRAAARVRHPDLRSRPSSARRSGLSVAGLVPVAEIQFGGFTMQAYHQLVGQLARLRYRSRGRYHCPVTVRSAVRRRRAHARAPQRLGGGAVHARARAERGGAVERGRRQGPADQRGAQRRPGARVRADPLLPHDVRGPRRRAPRAARRGARGARAGRRGDHHVGRDGRRRGRRPPTLRAGTARRTRRRDRPAHARAARRRHDRARRRTRAVVSSSCTRRR